ncbi:MAG: primosomal protein N' family DNA-binding protein, partial [Rhodobacterales bacterium]
MSPGFFNEGDLIAVMTTQPFASTLDYRAPEGGCLLGAFVEVPLGPRKVLGVVWGVGVGDFDISKIRAVIRVLDAVPMRDELRSFLERAGNYTLTPLPAMGVDFQISEAGGITIDPIRTREAFARMTDHGPFKPEEDVP